MDDFKLIAIANGRLRPFGAGDDASIVFDGDAVAFEVECGDEIGKSRGSQLRKFPGLPINDELHVSNLSAGVILPINPASELRS